MGAFAPTSVSNEVCEMDLVFFVGLEAKRVVYAYALNHVSNGKNRIATIANGYPSSVMNANYDPATNYLCAKCDGGLVGASGTTEVDDRLVTIRGH